MCNCPEDGMKEQYGQTKGSIYDSPASAGAPPGAPMMGGGMQMPMGLPSAPDLGPPGPVPSGGGAPGGSLLNPGGGLGQEDVLNEIMARMGQQGGR